MAQELEKRNHYLDILGLKITDETEWDFQRETRCGGCGGVVMPLPRKLLIRHYDDGVWEILDENHLPLISGTVNDRGLKR